MITDEERALWIAAVEPAAPPSVHEAYAHWLLLHDPRRGELLQKRLQGKLSLAELFEERRVWAEAIGATHAFDDIDFSPVPKTLRWDADAIEAVDHLFERLPFLEVELHFSSATDAAAVFDCPAVSKIRRLSFWAYVESYEPGEAGVYDRETHYFGDRVLAALCASPRLAELDSLALFDHQIGPPCATVLAGARFAHLRRLCIVNEKLGDEGASELAQSSVVASLRTLSLHGCDIATSGAMAFARSPNLANLEVLNLRKNPIGARAAAALRASTCLSKVRTLIVDD